MWWDGELFTGKPDWPKLLSAKAPRLTAEEQAFLDGPCEELCRMIDDWDITHRRADMPPEVWDFLKTKGFFAMIIPKQYGGLEFSAYAHSCVLVKLASRSATVSSTVAVPNSLGPARAAAALRHRGAEEPLPAATRARRGHALLRAHRRRAPAPTPRRSRTRASSAAARTRAREVLGLRLNFAKRYITLAPVATVIGLAFKLYDPEKLLGGDKTDYGITCALIPRDTPGVDDRPPPLPAQRAVPERAALGQGRVRAARLHHRRAEDGGPGLAHAGRAAVRRPLHLAAVERDRRREGRHLRHRPPMRASASSSTSRSASSRASRPRSRAWPAPPTSWMPRAR